jgi:hypothetical protein
MGIFVFETHKSLGGRDANDQWSNRYYVRADYDLGSAEMRADVNYIKDAEVSMHLSEVHFMRGHCFQLAENTYNRPDKESSTVEFQEKGARAVNFIGLGLGNEPEYTNPMMPEDLCVVIKREANKQRNGRLFYRNCLLRDDVKTGNDNEFILVNPTLFSSLGGGQNTLLGMFNAGLPNGTFVMPNPAGLLVQTSRDIVAHSLGGVSLMKSDRKRITSPSALAASIQRQLNALARQAEDLLAAQAATGTTPTGGMSLSDMIDLASNLVEVLPIGRAAKVVVPTILRALPPG